MKCLIQNKILIIGAGNIAALFDNPTSSKILTHAHAFKENKNFTLKGFYDIDYSRAKIAAQRWGCEAFSNLEDAMESVDIVCICVPDKYHAKILEEVSKYTVKLVVAEKPLAKSLDEAKRIKQLYDKKKIPLLLNYSRRYLVEYQILKKDISKYGAFCKGTGYYGKGLQHNGSHMIDILSYLVGEVMGIERASHDISDFEEDDLSYDVTLRIKNGFFNMTAIDSRVATIFELDLFFEKARVRIIDGGNVIETYRVEGSKEYNGYFNYTLLERKNVEYSNALLGLVDNVKSYLENEEELVCTMDDGVKVLDICSRIRGDLT